MSVIGIDPQPFSAWYALLGVRHPPIACREVSGHFPGFCYDWSRSASPDSKIHRKIMKSGVWAAGAGGQSKYFKCARDGRLCVGGVNKQKSALRVTEVQAASWLPIQMLIDDDTAGESLEKIFTPGKRHKHYTLKACYRKDVKWTTFYFQQGLGGVYHPFPLSFFPSLLIQVKDM